MLKARLGKKKFNRAMRDHLKKMKVVSKKLEETLNKIKEEIKSGKWDKELKEYDKQCTREINEIFLRNNPIFNLGKRRERKRGKV